MKYSRKRVEMFNWIWFKEEAFLENTALVVALVRDVVFLIILVVALIALCWSILSHDSETT